MKAVKSIGVMNYSYEKIINIVHHCIYVENFINLPLNYQRLRAPKLKYFVLVSLTRRKI